MSFYQFLKECENIKIFCFDIKQYFFSIDELEVVVWANIEGKTYQSSEIKINTYSFCEWNGKKWEITRGQEVIETKGIQQFYDACLAGCLESFEL